jgi:predicted nucleic acid-binding Zn finger protein
MINPWQILKTEGELNRTVRDAFVGTYGKRGAKAVRAVEQGRVKKYRDYFVVVGESGEYCVDGSFCSCDAQKYGKDCWHTLAVRLAAELGAFETYDLWYYNEGLDDPEEDS